MLEIGWKDKWGIPSLGGESFLFIHDDRFEKGKFSAEDIGLISHDFSFEYNLKLLESLEGHFFYAKIDSIWFDISILVSK